MKILLVLSIISWNVFAEEKAHVHSSACSHSLQRLLMSMENVGKEEIIECSPPLKLPELDQESKLIAEKKWYGGAPDCRKPGAKEPPYEILEVNKGFYIMRQNKCINFEAPFVYLYIGDDGALLFDTGSTSDAETMPIRKWVDEVLAKHPKGDKLKLTVAHSHSHGDHCAGDEQFMDRPNTTVIGTNPDAVAKAFNVKNWPDGEGSIDLGGRKLSIIPIPGHEASSIAVYDHKSGDMLTGDTIYPGNIFLSRYSWKEFKDSVNRLHKFSEKHPVRNFLGAHIEMSADPGKDFPYGSTYHPNEHNLPLRQEHLNEIKQYLDGNPDAKTKYFADIILRLGS